MSEIELMRGHRSWSVEGKEGKGMDEPAQTGRDMRDLVSHIIWRPYFRSQGKTLVGFLWEDVSD